MNDDIALCEIINAGYIKQAKQQLLDSDNNNINVNELINDDNALICGVIGNNIKIVKLLLDNGTNVNSREYFSGRTAIFYAVINGNMDIFELLIENGADISIRDDYNNDVVAMACLYRHENAYRFANEYYPDDFPIFCNGGYTKMMKEYNKYIFDPEFNFSYKKILERADSINDRGEWRPNKHNLFPIKTRQNIFDIFYLTIIDGCVLNNAPFELIDQICIYLAYGSNGTT